MTDPIDADDESLRHELLRARDHAAGEAARNEVLADRVQELETELHALGEHNARLADELNRSPLNRVVSAVRRRMGGS